MHQLKPVPFYMLAGSLGTGKTTLLLRLLEHWKGQGRNVGVVMNESGQVSIDGPRAGTLASQVVNLAGGCVCCDTKDDLAWGIGQLITDYRSDLIVLECSGMANPTEVIDAVTDAFVSRMVTLRQTIALLQPAADPEQAYSHPVIAHSLRCADDIVLNKRDLFLSTLWETSCKVLVARNPYARLWEASHARLDIDALLTPREQSRSILPSPNVTFDAHPPTATLSQPLSESRAKTRAAYHPLVVTVRLPGLMNRRKFADWMKGLPAGLERAKGFLRFVDDSSLQEFQYAPPGVNQVEPLHLLDEPPHAIVLIGRAYNQENCRTALLACVETDIRTHQRSE